MRGAKLENLEAIALIVLIMTNKIILNLPKTILSNVGTSAWINAIYVSIITILVILLIVKLFKNFPGSDILDVSNYLGGKFLKSLVAISYIILFIVNAVMIVRSFSESIKIIYFNALPLMTIILFFVVTACIANLFGLKVLSKTNLIIAPLALLSIFIIVLASIQNFIPQRLFPILGHGINQTFIQGSSNVFLYSVLAYLFLIIPMLKHPKDFKKVSLISVGISAFYLITSIICLQLVFPFIYETKEHLSIYLLIRMARSGDVVQRFTSIFFFIWILSVLCYISISLYFAMHVTKKCSKIKNPNVVNYCLGSIIFGSSLIVSDFSKYIIFIDKIFKPTTSIFLFVFNIFIMILANIKYKVKNKRTDS